MDLPLAREAFERALPVVDAVLASISRRNGLEGDEADAFRSHAIEHLLKDDYRVFRQFEGGSELKTYLSVVLSRCYLDYRNAHWGRWRPSAAAKRFGKPGILLDAFMNRDGCSLEEAVRRVESRSDVSESESELRSLAARVPHRVRRRHVSLEALKPSAPAADGADARLLRSEATDRAEQALTALDEAMATLPTQAQAVLRLLYWEGLTVAQVARTLGLPQKPMYRSLGRYLAEMRRALEARGISERELMELVSERAVANAAERRSGIDLQAPSAQSAR